MTIRITFLSILSIFNLVAAVYSLIAFFSTYPVMASLYFFVSLPLTIYFSTSKADYLDRKFVAQKPNLETNPF